MWRKLLLLCVTAVFVTCCLLAARSALAQEGREGREGEPAVEKGDERAERAELRKMARKATEILRRIRAGEDLTEEDKELLKKYRKQRDVQRKKWARERDRQRPPRAEVDAMRRGPGPMAEPARAKALRHDERLNVIDRAYYEIAEIHLAKKKYEDAVAALEQLIKKSPDKRAVSLTRLNLAELYRKQLADTKRAIEEYKKVTGEFALAAQTRLAQLFEELDQIDEAVEQFENIAKTATDKTQKVLALGQLAGLLARNGREDEAIAVLQRLIKSVSYEEAAKISKALLEEKELREQREQKEHERARAQMMRAWQQRLGARRPRRDAEMRPDRIRPRKPRKRNDDAPRERPIPPAPGRDKGGENENPFK